MKNICGVQGIITILMTIILAIIMILKVTVAQELLVLFCTSYGSMVTYYFSHKNDKNHTKNAEITEEIFIKEVK